MTELSKVKNKPLRVLQFTDTHFFENSQGRLLGVDTAKSFAEVYELARRTYGQPDFYIFTGDLSQDETEESYKRLSQALKDAGAPCYSLPGNHDSRNELARGLASGQANFRPDRQIVISKWQVILLDSLLEKHVDGYLAKAELDFLEECLAKNKNLHSLVCLHHPPVPVGSAWVDRLGLKNAAEFLAILDKHTNVRAVLWGHVHQEFETLRNGVHFLCTPSTCVQFKPKTETFAVDAVGAGFRFLELHDDGQIYSKVCRSSAVANGLELSSGGY